MSRYATCIQASTLPSCDDVFLWVVDYLSVFLSIGSVQRPNSGRLDPEGRISFPFDIAYQNFLECKLEKPHLSVLPLQKFYWRLAKFGLIALALAGFSLFVGMLGYRYFESQSWPESFLNAAMLLGAMGPVGEPQTDAGKIFAGCYALYCGLVFLFIAGLLVTPVAHRFLHIFHADPDENDSN